MLFASLIGFAATSADTAAGAILVIVYLAVLVLCVAAGWKTFEKANQPGWAILIPIYNMVVMMRVAGKPLWWLLLFFIPVVNWIVGVVIAVAIARNFGKGVGFGLGLALLPFIFYPILGFGDAEYVPTTGNETADIV